MTKAVKQFAQHQDDLISLCKALHEKRPWGNIAKIIKGLDDQEPESIRRGVLGYFSSVLLNKMDPQAALILEEFSEPYYDSGRAGLILSCFRVSSL
jgi:flagellar motility protein MotE (MotC chaperone)